MWAVPLALGTRPAGLQPRERHGGAWQWNYMFQLGLIIGGGTAQIQKNIIAERGLEMPREPNPADMARQKQGAD